jgi:hypothetical protein
MMTMSVRTREFRDDQRGAVMLTGLFMSVFLIGSLWFIMGIGDAIVFRDKMQEATDHGVFAASALNAKGMNFISLCNLIMLVGTMIHIVLGLVTDIAGAIYTVCLAACLASWGAACGCISPTWRAWSTTYRIWDGYFTGMKAAFKGLSMAEKAASYIYPAMGVVASYQVGSKYGGDSRTGPVRVISLGPSQIPGAAIRGLGNLAGGKGAEGAKATGGIFAQSASNMTKEGLPVSQKEYSDLCKKVVSFTTGGVTELLGMGKSLGGGIGGKALRIFNSVIGGAIQWRYCNKSASPPFFDRSPDFWLPWPTSGHGGGMDSFWGEKGFMIVYPPAQNGNVWFQTWGMNFMPKLTDNNESKVKMAGQRMGGDKQSAVQKYSKTETPTGYFAQSEFYFDCDENWEGLACNAEDHATFAIKWRARLRRLDLPALTSGIVGAGLDALGSLPGVKEIQEKLPKQASEKLGEVLGMSGLGQAALDKALGSALDQAKEWATGQVTNAAGKLDPTLGGFGIGVYH